MVKTELFTIYDGTRTPSPVLAEDDLEDGIFSDESDIPRISAKQVQGRLTARSNIYNSSVDVYRIRFPYGTYVKPDMRVRQESTGNTFVISSVLLSKLASKEVIVTLKS